MRNMIFLVIFCLGLPVFSQDMKMGFVDVKIVMTATKEGKRAKKNLESFFKKRNKVLQKEGKKIEAELIALQKKRGVLSEKAFQEKLSQHQIKKVNYDKSLAKAQIELQQKERDLTLPLIQKMQKVIENYGKKNKYALILNKDVVLYSQASEDLTSQIVKAYNKKHK